MANFKYDLEELPEVKSDNIKGMLLLDMLWVGFKLKIFTTKNMRVISKFKCDLPCLTTKE